MDKKDPKVKPEDLPDEPLPADPSDPTPPEPPKKTGDPESPGDETNTGG